MKTEKGETGKCTCKIFPSRLFYAFTVQPRHSQSRTIVLSVHPQFSRAIRKTALTCLLCVHSSARAIRKVALSCLPRLRRIFAHKRALSSSDCQSPDSYASIKLSPDNRWLNCWLKNRVCSIFLLITVVYLWYNQVIYYSTVWNGRE